MPRLLRVSASVVAFLLIVTAIVLSGAGRSSRVPLFATPLHPEQLEEVQERLAEWNVEFIPSADNVAVNSKRRSDLLLRLSLAGVPHAHVEGSGDVMSKIGALTPQSVVDAQTRAGVAADIELGLRGIEGVDDARVIVAPAKPAFFADQSDHAASASVRLRLHPGARLSRAAISGIRAFVAAGVAGLDAQNVTILDDRGIALSDGQGGGEDVRELEASVQNILDQTLGAAAALVRIHAEYDATARQTHEIRNAPVARALAVTQEGERYTGDGKHYERSSSQIDRGSDTRDVVASSPAGRLVRLSVAVVLNASRGIDAYKVRALVAAAAGIDPRRGDTIVVTALPFPHAVAAKRDGWWLAYGAIVSAIPALIFAMVVLAVARGMGRPLGAIVRASLERAATLRTGRAVAGFAPAQVRGALENEPPHAAAAIISALPAATAAAVLDMYPEHERSAIVSRMNRPKSPLVPDLETWMRRG